MTTGGVWRVQHCCPIFLTSPALPASCPVCRQPLEESSVATQLPVPFHHASDRPRTVLLRPTVGEFEDYRGGDLHVGVSDGSGRVLAFDQDGLRLCPAAEWPQCLVIPLPASDSDAQNSGDRIENPENNIGDVVTSRASSSYDRGWDDAIAHFLNSTEWRAEVYDEISCNCFSFLLAFLERTGFLPAEDPWTRERFAEEVVLPVTRRAAKYLTLRRRVQQDGWWTVGVQRDAV
ncbi:uncharacterized protein LOC122377031 [Amphibalanus amphitrite]|uniref:uncharacterized protein LOC122377031 n=1 Tax=Amphibalanus amphitrite TaxID=1232801 RepID=UPI001C9299AD|nr:uncharacterized protein LOC122377031 [Amphibalanus amphitrite]